MNRMQKCFPWTATNIIELFKKLLPVAVAVIFLLSVVSLLKASPS
jgi:hypothetical protein